MLNLRTTNQWKPYSSIINDNVFDCITSSSRVLEVGPFNGWFSDLILQKNPAHLELVESNTNAVSFLKEKYKNNSTVKVNYADIFDAIKTYPIHSFDVVVVFGVLYHWHSPIEFMEQMSNLLDPMYVCIDNIDAPDLFIADEEINVGGSRNITTNKKTANLSLTLTSSVITKAMTNLGYKEKYYRSMSDIQLLNKEKFSVWKFQRQ